MKPNFALILSSDGIGLLHRSVTGVAEGWNMLGEAALEASDQAGDQASDLGADLGTTLAALRKKAAQFDPSGLHCTLVLPNNQIKYITLPRADMSGDDPQQAALEALEGTTPYEVEALVVDWSLATDHLHIAAVARETLTEAENFAAQYGFNPVCFTAAPDAGDYTGAPYFGVTSSHDAGDPVEHDKAPVRVTGSAFMPKAVLPDLAETPGKTADKIADTIPATPFTSIRMHSDDLPEAAPTKTPKTPSEPDVSGVTDATLPIEPEPEPKAPDPPLKAATPATKPTSFKSSRAPHSAPPKPVKTTPAKATSALPPAPNSETARMTVFGARNPNKTTGGPGRSWRGLAALVVVSLAGLAALAMMTFDDGLAGLFRGPEQARITDIPDPADPPQTDLQPQEITNLDTATAPDEAPQTEPPTDVAEGAGDPAVTPLSDDAIDTAVIAALQPADAAPDAITPDAIPPDVLTPETPPPAQQTLILPDPVELTPDQARARYAATGIWQMAPVGPQAPPAQSLKTLYQAAIDTPVNRPNTSALPLPRATDTRPLTLLSPPDPGTEFNLDARGLVIATKDGALTPQGIRVYAGKPALVPPARPGTPAQSATTEIALDPALLRQTRPRPRPGDLAEQHERSALGGRTRAELAKLRPKIRPQSAQEAAALVAAGTSSAIDAAVSEAALSNLSAQAITASPRPTPRPEDFSEIVAQIRAAQQPAVTPDQPLDANAVALVTPTIPTSASIARAATDENVIKLRKINLIGVYGTPNSRRALVRLPNGRYRKVVIGDRLDGGKVAAISDNELRYIKRGRNVVLKLPRG